MKRIKSKINVTYNNSSVSSKTTEMTGEILEMYQDTTKGDIEVVYRYIDADGDVESLGKYSVSREEADGLFSLISVNLPDVSVVGISEYNDIMFLEGFKMKMSEYFDNLEVSDIKIID